MKKRIIILCAVCITLIAVGVSTLSVTSCGPDTSLATGVIQFLLPDSTTKELTEEPVPRTVRFKATFSRRLEWNEQSDVAERFILLQGGTQVPASVNWDPYDQEVTLTPTAPLSYSTTYSVGIEGLVQGNVQGIENTSFTTVVRGDVDGDGFPDTLIGAPEATGGADQGRVYLFLGSASGMADCDLATCRPSATIIGSANGDYVGAALSLDGDVNGDGYADLLIGADGATSGKGQLIVLYGAATMTDCDLAGGCTPDITITGENDNDFLGASAAYAGDVSGDGFDDLIGGATGHNRAYVFNGGTSLSNAIAAADADAILTGSAESEGFGVAVDTAGDINGDGYDDVIVGDWKWAAGDIGRAYLFLGASSGVTTCDLSATCTAAATFTGAADNDLFGSSVAGLGDVNDDGYDDVIVGATYGDGSVANSGAAYVFQGSASGIGDCDLSSGCTPDTALAGGSANDVFGFRSAPAGDVNGDSFADTLVGSMWADGGGTDKGAAYIFLGSSSGIANCDIAAGGTPATTVVGAADNDLLGFSVSTGFDLNRDGYDDILVGASGAAGGGTARGRAYTFEGSASGIANCNLGGTCTASSIVTGASDNDQLGNVR